MQIKANFVSCKTFDYKGKALNLVTCINENLGTFNFFVPVPLKLDYLKTITIEFDVSVVNQRLVLRFVGVR